MSYTNGLDKPTDYFNTVLYTGNGTDNHAITGVGFQPDLVWGKARNAVLNNWIQNSVSGGTNYMYVNATDAEATASTVLKTFDSDGFTLGTATSWNGSGNNYASWNWLAGGTASSNTDGSITSTVSANTTSGFSIVSYTGSSSNSTVGHGLGSAPSMMIIKNRSSSYEWAVYHKDLSANHNLYLNNTNASAQSDVGDLWVSTAPTSSVFTVGGNKIYVNYASENYIAYCFAEKKGYSKFGSYTGNGSTDGTFVYTGMKTSFVLLKETSNANNWMLFDNKRSAFNLMDDFISPDIADAETTGNANNRMDMLSNGFKIRGTGSATNRSGSNFIYMAFAENPFVTSTGIPTTAR